MQCDSCHWHTTHTYVAVIISVTPQGLCVGGGGAGVNLALATVVACLIARIPVHTSQHVSFLSHEFCSTSTSMHPLSEI